MQGHGPVQERAWHSLRLHLPFDGGGAQPGLGPGRGARLGGRGRLRRRSPHRCERQAHVRGDLDLLRAELEGVVDPERDPVLALRRLHRPRRGQGSMRHRRHGPDGALRRSHGRRHERRRHPRRGRARHPRRAWRHEGRLCGRRGQQNALRPPHQGAWCGRGVPFPRGAKRGRVGQPLQGLRLRRRAEPERAIRPRGLGGMGRREARRRLGPGRVPRRTRSRWLDRLVHGRGHRLGRRAGPPGLQPRPRDGSQRPDEGGLRVLVGQGRRDDGEVLRGRRRLVSPRTTISTRASTFLPL
mmetsp:Transcript_31850/g.93166  ORF Transcript_31850/g.93166 Transcript_31850/m.93166 type:complete len:298 (+) Transcript_31850:387-1280(+)